MTDASTSSNLVALQVAIAHITQARAQVRALGGGTAADASQQLGYALEALKEVQPSETTGNAWPEYTNAVGEAGHQYMQRCDGRISSGFFYWHELWDVLNLAASNSLEHVRQSPQGSVPAIGAPTRPAAPCSQLEPKSPHAHNWVDGTDPEQQVCTGCDSTRMTPEKASESPDPVYCSACGQEDRDCYCDPSTPPENGKGDV